EIQLVRAEGQGAGFDVVTPSVSVLVATPVAVVDKIAAKHGTAEVAAAYLRFLYTDEAQEIGARHGFRPVDDKILRRHADQFPRLELVSIEQLGGWPALQAKHFADGGVFDQIFAGR
ncbi:MAG TPA: substrate-binding domain-containing protein, partial [Polyangia bacterium]|nr:substrate-binding domain-containing protein [Polyangia bacterium]